MTPTEVAEFRKKFFRTLTIGPLDPGDPRYVPLYELDEFKSQDPVAQLQFAIEANAPTERLSSEFRGTVQLLSGFRGTGKSTELRRLQKLLQEAGHKVFLFDIEDYINTAQPLEPIDFLFACAFGLADAVIEQGNKDPLQEGYLTRLQNFLKRTEVEIPEGSAGLKATADAGATKVEASANLKFLLKDNPSFRSKAKARWANSIGQFSREVHEFIRGVASELVPPHGDRQVVLLVDSIEHIRASSKDAEAVQSSIEHLFTAHVDKISFPGVHTVFTVHPYLKIKYPNISALFEPGGLQLIPTIKVRDRQAPNQDDLGKPRKEALDALERIIEKRGEWWHLLGGGPPGRERLDQISLASGGHLRDLIRLLAEITRRAREIPVSKENLDAAIAHVRNEALPIADDDALWLADIARSQSPCLPSQDKLPALARFLDAHQVLCYRNGNEWFDVHPLLRETVLQQAVEVRARRAAQAAPKPTP